MKDLDKPEVMAKQEFQFIKFIVHPLVMIFNEMLGGSMKLALQNCENNMKEYETIYTTIEKDMKEAKEKRNGESSAKTPTTASSEKQS
jgi:hypothetical protein